MRAANMRADFDDSLESSMQHTIKARFSCLEGHFSRGLALSEVATLSPSPGRLPDFV
jgi:hypothetical protein